MASIEFITKRIEGKQKEITKLENKLARIIKAKESDWENNPYYYCENDLRWTTRDLEAAKDALAKYEADLAMETEKDASRNVTAIIEFLNEWANRVFDHYAWSFPRYLAAKAEWYKADHEHCEWHNNGGWKQSKEVRKMKEDEYRRAREEFRSNWNWIATYDNFGKFDGERLTKELEQDKKVKYDDIINRANEICGTIKDASGLSVGEKGELNGIVYGDRGNARITTIGAGGYNIQCFHFRTLIHRA